MINWSLLVFIVLWLFVTIAIVQIGRNTIKAKGEDKRWKGSIISGIVAAIWTAIIIIIYRLIKWKLSFVLKFINGLLNYIWGLVPKWLLLWFLIPLAVAYVWMIIKGVIYFFKKRAEFTKTGDKKKSEDKKPAELTDKEIEKLNQIAENHQAKTAMLFRKIVRQAQKDINSLYVSKLNDNYWIPIYTDEQFKMIKKYADELKTKFDKPEYPSIIKLNKTSIQSFDKKTGQEKFRDEINLEKEEK